MEGYLNCSVGVGVRCWLGVGGCCLVWMGWWGVDKGVGGWGKFCGVRFWWDVGGCCLVLMGVLVEEGVVGC